MTTPATSQQPSNNNNNNIITTNARGGHPAPPPSDWAVSTPSSTTKTTRRLAAWPTPAATNRSQSATCIVDTHTRVPLNTARDALSHQHHMLEHEQHDEKRHQRSHETTSRWPSARDAIRVTCAAVAALTCALGWLARLFWNSTLVVVHVSVSFVNTATSLILLAGRIAASIARFCRAAAAITAQHCAPATRTLHRRACATTQHAARVTSSLIATVVRWSLHVYRYACIAVRWLRHVIASAVRRMAPAARHAVDALHRLTMLLLTPHALRLGVAATVAVHGAGWQVPSLQAAATCLAITIAGEYAVRWGGSTALAAIVVGAEMCVFAWRALVSGFNFLRWTGGALANAVSTWRPSVSRGLSPQQQQQQPQTIITTAATAASTTTTAPRDASTTKPHVAIGLPLRKHEHPLFVPPKLLQSASTTTAAVRPAQVARQEAAVAQQQQRHATPTLVPAVAAIAAITVNIVSQAVVVMPTKAAAAAPAPTAVCAVAAAREATTTRTCSAIQAAAADLPAAPTRQPNAASSPTTHAAAQELGVPSLAPTKTPAAAAAAAASRRRANSSGVKARSCCCRERTVSPPSFAGSVGCTICSGAASSRGAAGPTSGAPSRWRWRAELARKEGCRNSTASSTRGRFEGGGNQSPNRTPSSSCRCGKSLTRTFCCVVLMMMMMMMSCCRCVSSHCVCRRFVS